MGTAYNPEGEIEQLAEFARPDNGGTIRSEAKPEMVQLTDGRHVLVWAEPPLYMQEGKVFAQILDSSGVAEGEPMLLATGYGEIAVTSDGGGGFVVSWGQGNTQAFATSGEPISDLHDLSAGGDVALATLEDGRIVAGFVEAGVLKCQLLAGDLSPLGSAFDVATAVTGIADIAALHDGGFAIGFKSGAYVASIKFDDEGSPAGPILQHGLPDADRAGEGYQERTSSNPSLVASGEAGYVIAWSESLWEDGWNTLQNFDEQVKAQRIGGDGSPAGDAFNVTTEDTGGFVTPTLFELDDGGFFVSWARGLVPENGEWYRGTIAYSLAARSFDANGNPTSDEFLIDDRPNPIESSGAIGQAANGDLFIAFDAGLRRDGRIDLARLRQFGEDVTSVGNAAPDTFTGTGADEFIYGADGNDRLIGGSGNDVLQGAGGADRLEAGDGADHLLGGAANDLVFGGAGDDVADGGAGADRINGGLGNDDLAGGEGDDTLDGGGGIDRLAGGAGSDRYIFRQGTILVEDLRTSAYEDVDTVVSAVDFTLGEGFENLVLTGRAVAGTGTSSANVIQGNGVANLLSGGSGDDKINAGGGDDRLLGEAGDDALQGGAGNDVIDGGYDNDTLSGGEGDDRLIGDDEDLLIGGAGDDIYVVDEVGYRSTTVVEAGDAGRDRIISTNSVYILPTNIEILELAGTARVGNGNEIDNLIIGNALANRLDGNGGADTVVGGDGNDELIGTDDGAADRLEGGEGDDEYYVDVLDAISDSGGVDLAVVAASYTLGDGVENLSLLAGGAFRGVGNALGNGIVGNASNNRLDGLGGNDELAGGAGNDLLGGGAGNDVLEGGAGDDRIYGHAGYDTVSYAGAGGSIAVDLLLTTAQDTGGAGIDRLSSIENIRGSVHDDRLQGSALGNAIRAGGGDDLVYGRDGNDYLAGDLGLDSLLGGNGNDILFGGGQDDRLNGQFGNDRLDGGLGDDRLQGGNGQDRLLGGAEDDQIDGGAGIDVMKGDHGADLFILDDGETGATRGTADRLLDWDGDDRLDLRTVDANAGTAGDQNFVFIEGGAFTGTAGELRAEVANGATWVEGDTDGDGLADLVIRIDGVQALTAGDFFG